MGAAVLAIASLATTIIGAGVGAIGQIQQGNSANAQAKYQAGVLRNNQILAERAAVDATARGKVEEDRQRIRTRQLQGRQRAVLAANGVVVDEGSALDITADTELLGEIDALTIRNNAEREAAYHRAQGSQFGSDANMALLSGKSAQQSGYLGAGGTLLSGAGTVASKWYSYKQDEVF